MPGKYFTKQLILLLIILFSVGDASGEATRGNKKERAIIATVNGESITTGEFEKTIESIKNKIGNADNIIIPSNTVILERLINRKLIAQEGGNIGFDSIPEFKMQMDVYRRKTLRELLLKNHLRNLKVNETEVDKLYKEAIKEYKIKSIFVEKEEDAKTLEDGLKMKADFDQLIAQMVAGGKAKGSGEEVFIKATEFNPRIVEIISKMNVGEISPVESIGNGFTVIQLTDIKFTDSPEIKEKAKKEALSRKQKMAFEAYTKSLIKKYAKINDKLLSSLDYEESVEKFTMYLTDNRIIAEIRGDKPITVAELSGEVKSKYYHGIEEAIAKKIINRRKSAIFNDILQKRILLKESMRKKMNETEEYKYKMKEFKEDLMFGIFMQKVIDPEVVIKEEELMESYESNKSEYMTPVMMKIISLTFEKRDEAEDAIEKLRKGMDFNWVKNNMITRENTDKDMVKKEFEGEILVVSELPEHVKKVVIGASSGDYRFCVDPENRYQVLYLQEVYPSVSQSYAEVRNTIAEKVDKEKRELLVEDWFGKLRKASDINIYIKNEKLEKIIFTPSK